MKKLSLAIMALILGFIFVFASVSGADEIKSDSGDILEIVVKKDDNRKVKALYHYIRKHFPDIKANRDAYYVFADIAGINNPQALKAGDTIRISRKKFRERMWQLKQAANPQNMQTTSRVVGYEKRLAQAAKNTPYNRQSPSALRTSGKVVTDNNQHRYPLFTVKVIKRIKLNKGETLSHMAKHLEPPKKPTPATNKALARFNGIKDENLVFEGQVIKIPNVLVYEQNIVGANPTTVGREQAIRMAIREANLSAKSAGINFSIDEGMASALARKIARSKRKRVLNGKTLLATTFGTGVQGWTKVNAKAELSGNSTSIRDGRYRAYVALADQCNNATIDAEKRSSVLLTPMPQMSMLPLLSKPLADGKALVIKDKKLLQTGCPDCLEFSNTNGVLYDIAHDGSDNVGDVLGAWMSNELISDCEWPWSAGLAHVSRWWDGESRESVAYQYEGDVHLFGGLVKNTGEHHQAVFRYVGGDKNSDGGFKTEHVDYKHHSESEIQNIYASMEWRYPDKKYFSKVRVTGEVELAENKEVNHRMIGKWNGEEVPLDDPEPEDEDTAWFSVNADIMKFDDLGLTKLVGKVLGGWQDNYNNLSFSPRVGLSFWGDGLIIYAGHTWNFSDPVADTWNIVDAEINLLKIYKNWGKRNAVSKNGERAADTEVTSMEKRLERMKQYENAK